MNREQYLSERSAIVDDYIASGQLRRYDRDIDRLNAAYEAAGGFADEAAASVGVPNTVSCGGQWSRDIAADDFDLANNRSM